MGESCSDNRSHFFLSKQQADVIVQPSGTPITQKKTSYAWTYDYAPSGATSIRPHAPIHIGERTYSYDANGNQLGWDHDQNGTRRTIVWDEENRIQSVFDNGHEKFYKYDDAGQRVIKRGPQGETVYVNQYFTLRNREIGTKHVYVGTTRAVSKLMKQDKPGANPNGQTPVEKDLYYFHPDHLGSSNLITDAQGQSFEHLEYFPFGETWVEESTNTQRTPYLFTAKELDEETGLYYFGARYYDPRTSVWQSADPILNRYLDGQHKGGVHNSFNLGLYGYAYQNPVKYTDPDGKAVETVWDVFNVALGAKSFKDNYKQGNYWSAALDAGGVLVDAAAVIVPGVPGGAGATIRAARGADKGDAGGATKSLVQANKAKGDAFEAAEIAKIKKGNPDSEVAQQLTIKTESGTKTRLDIVTRDAQGNIACVECKSSATAPLTKNQKAGFPEIERSGGTVVGKGKPGFPGGTKIPATKVDIVRPPSAD